MIWVPSLSGHAFLLALRVLPRRGIVFISVASSVAVCEVTIALSLFRLFFRRFFLYFFSFFLFFFRCDFKYFYCFCSFILLLCLQLLFLIAVWGISLLRVYVEATRFVSVHTCVFCCVRPPAYHALICILLAIPMPGILGE